MWRADWRGGNRVAIDWSTILKGASPLASGGIDPDQWIANGGKDDDQGVSYQAKPGEKRTTLGPTSALPPKPYATGISRPPNDGNVSSISSPQPAGNAPNPVSEAPSGGAVPSTVSPSGGNGSKFSDMARSMLGQKTQALQAAQGIPNAPDVGGLESQRVAATAATPDPNASQFRPGLGRRIARGVEGVGLGLAEGGLRGAIAGGIAPQTTGLAGYQDPNSAFYRAKQANDQTVGGLDQQIKAAQDTQKDVNERVKNNTEIANSYGTGAQQATAAQTAEDKPTSKAQIITAGDGSLFSVDPDDPTHPQPVIGPGGKPITGKSDGKYVQLEIGGEPHTVEVDDKGNTIKDLGKTGQKPTNIHVGEGGTWSLQEQKDGKGGVKTVLMNSKSGEIKDAPAGLQKAGASVKGDATTLKAYQPVLDSAERVNIMTQNAEDALHGNQQAGLSLLSNHIGMTMGLVKGARINKEIYKEAEQSQPWLQGVKAHFDDDGYLSGVALAPKQIGNMVDLAPGRMREDAGKARSQAKYLGASDDGPDRTPSRSTMRYYLFKAGGDKAKAKEAAAADGWTVSDGK